MKKKGITKIIMLFIIFIILLFSYWKSTKSKKLNPNKIKIAEVTHSVFYAPLYVALENGYFKDEGLDIDLILISGADKVSAAVLSGDVEIGFAGAESAIYVYKNSNTDYLQIFAGLTKRDGQFIISKYPNKDFSLKDLYGKEILVGRSSGMPALNFLNALKNNNIDPQKININYSIDFAALSGTFIGGTGEYVNLFEPNALKIEQEGYGYVVSSIGKLSGEMPYTTFYAKKSYINSNTNIIKKFNRAMDKALLYTKEHTSKDIAKTILNQFPDQSLNDLEVIIERYKDNDSWLENTYISKSLLDNLQELLVDNKLIEKPVDYDDLILNIDSY